jgi:hypothetical protein
MAKYMLLLRDNGTMFGALSPEEIQRVVQRYGDWRRSLGDRIVSASKLRDKEGRVLNRNGSKTVVMDGPFTETKEIVGGYFLIEADSYDHAIELSRDCPHFDFGSIEIRELQPTPTA